MTLSTFQRIQGLELHPARIKVGLANGKVARLYGMVENVPIKVNNLSFSMDFAIFEMKEYCFTPILIGRPFLAMIIAIINVNKKELSIRSGKEYEVFKFPSMSRGKMKRKGNYTSTKKRINLNVKN